MTEVDISLGRLFKIWWAILWRSAIVCVLFGVVCVLLWRALTWPALLSDWAPAPSIYAVAALSGMLLGIPFGLLAVRWFLHVSFSDFQIRLVSKEQRPPKFRLEPRIGNIKGASFRTKSVALHRPASPVTQVADQRLAESR